MPVSIKTMLDEAIQALSNTDSAKSDAEILLSHIIRKPRSYLYTWPERCVGKQQLDGYRKLIEARSTGKPVAHITGNRSFWNQELKITQESLIPRPETELLVELALEKIPENCSYQIADLGTGTGAVGIAIASERLDCDITCTDINFNNLLLAKQNAAANSVSNVQFVCSDWLSSMGNNSLDVIVSNPPYIAEKDPHLDQGDVRFESQLALVSGLDGLDDIRNIVASAKPVLRKEGWLLLEHGYRQSNTVKGLMRNNGYIHIKSLADLNGNPRVTIGCNSTDNSHLRC